MKKILIDGRFIGVGESISRYVLEMTKGILALDPENSYTLLIRPQGEASVEKYPEIVNAPNLRIDVLDIPHYTIAEQTKLLSYLKRENYDLVHFTQFNHPLRYKKPYVVTIHDLTLFGHLHYFSSLKGMAYRFVMGSAVKHSKKIIAISEYTKKDIKEFYHTKDDKFAVIYHGVDFDEFNNKIPNLDEKIKHFKEKYKIKDQYFLYVGAWKKHKNVLGMLKAYEKFVTDHNADNVPELVLVGKIDDKEPEVLLEIDRINEALKKITNKKMVITTGFVDIKTDAMSTIYSGALSYIIPSFSEGFGWPPLEAMACGTPVIASNESCIPEILGEAARYFDPYNVEEMAKAMEEIASDENLRQELSQKGLEQVKKYDWKNTAQQTLEVYRGAIQAK